MINYVPVTANTTLHTLVFPLPSPSLTVVCKVWYEQCRSVNGSAKVWFQEKADIGKVLDMTDLEELTDDFIKSQLLR